MLKKSLAALAATVVLGVPVQGQEPATRRPQPQRPQVHQDLRGPGPEGAIPRLSLGRSGFHRPRKRGLPPRGPAQLGAGPVDAPTGPAQVEREGDPGGTRDPRAQSTQGWRRSHPGGALHRHARGLRRLERDRRAPAGRDVPEGARRSSRSWRAWPLCSKCRLRKRARGTTSRFTTGIARRPSASIGRRRPGRARLPRPARVPGPAPARRRPRHRLRARRRAAGGGGDPPPGDRGGRARAALHQRDRVQLPAGHQPLRHPRAGGEGLWPPAPRIRPPRGRAGAAGGAARPEDAVEGARFHPPAPARRDRAAALRPRRRGRVARRAPRAASDHHELARGRRAVPDPAPRLHRAPGAQGAQPRPLSHAGLRPAHHRHALADRQGRRVPPRGRGSARRGPSRSPSSWAGRPR